MRRRLGKWLALLLILAGFVYPFETTVVPAWTVKVTDERGEPCAGILVTQTWRHYTLDHQPGERGEQGQTDGNGHISFPERIIKASLISRIGRTILTGVMLLAHGSSGIRADVFVGGEDFFKSARYVPGKPLPDRLILPLTNRCEPGRA